MNTHQAILASLDLSSRVLNSYIGDLTDQDLMHRPPGCNHLAWQLGHLIVSECGLLAGVSPGSAIELPETSAARHARDATDDNDPTHFESRQRYQQLLEQVHDATRGALARFKDDELDQPAPEQMQAMCPTVGHVFVLIASHGLMHAGQFVPVRRELGKPIVI